MNLQEPRERRMAAKNAGASIAEQFGRNKRKRTNETDQEVPSQPIEVALQGGSQPKTKKPQSSADDAAINHAYNKSPKQTAAAVEDAEGHARKQSEGDEFTQEENLQPLQKRKAPANRSAARTAKIKKPMTITDETTLEYDSGSGDDRTTNSSPPLIHVSDTSEDSPDAKQSRDAPPNKRSKKGGQDEAKRAPSASKKASKTKNSAGKAPIDAAVEDGEVQPRDRRDHAITVISSARPRLNQVYTSVIFRTSADDNAEAHRTTKLGAFCFKHNRTMPKSQEPALSRPKTRVRHVDSQLFRELIKPPTAEMRQEYQKLASEEKINTITGEPMPNPRSKDFVKKFRERYYPSGNTNPESARAETNEYSRYGQTLSGDANIDGLRPGSVPATVRRLVLAQADRDGLAEEMVAFMETRRENEALIGYSEARDEFEARQSQLEEDY